MLNVHKKKQNKLLIKSDGVLRTLFFLKNKKEYYYFLFHLCSNRDK